MTTLPVQRADATPGVVEDPIAAAEAVSRDPTKKGTPEWLAAMQLLADEGRNETQKGNFDELEKEMQALKGMSEI